MLVQVGLSDVDVRLIFDVFWHFAGHPVLAAAESRRGKICGCLTNFGAQALCSKQPLNITLREG